MKLADLFVSPNFIKVYEYYDVELYFDTETKFFYELEAESEDGWIVTEYRPTHYEYLDMMKEFGDVIKNTKLK